MRSRSPIFSATRMNSTDARPESRLGKQARRLALSPNQGVRLSRCWHLTLHTKPVGFGGGERVRTDDPLLAKQVLSQLSYAPKPART
jgi:hypothetical protein